MHRYRYTCILSTRTPHKLSTTRSVCFFPDAPVGQPCHHQRKGARDGYFEYFYSSRAHFGGLRRKTSRRGRFFKLTTICSVCFF